MGDCEGNKVVILVCFGTRPEFIKIKPLIKEFEGKIPYKLLFTGQHVDLLAGIDESIERLVISDEGENRLDSIVASIMSTVHVFDGARAVLVQGDTTSVMAMALAAFHRRIPVIHLEAGLRTYDKNNPYPEEINRQIVSRIADIHLCPTEGSKENLVREGVGGKIYVVGNTVLDNLVEITPQYTNKVIVTLHRRENHHQIKDWFMAVDELARENTELEFILPIHPNPNVIKHKDVLKHVRVVEPMEYNEFIQALAESRLVITDSGGLQEETSFLKKKCLVCRKTTERPEGLGVFSFLVPEPNLLKDAFQSVNNDYYVNEQSPYGDGSAARRILEIVKNEI
tara:strand:+ start:50 stop:1069 length:1020 start_codon:yes stop_codon:yes gene_type:complete